MSDNPTTQLAEAQNETGRWPKRIAVVSRRIVAEALASDPGLTIDLACVSDREQRFLAILNAYRASNGKAPLTLSLCLTSAAHGHAKSMALNDYFSHTGEDGSTFGQRITAAGYPRLTYRGEIICAAVESADAALEVFKRSPTHNSGMLSKLYRAVGIGYYYWPESRYKHFWVCCLGGSLDPKGGPNHCE